MKFIHLFDEYSNGEIGDYAVTIATDIKESNKSRRISIGYSIKSKHDRFIKSVGNKIAMENMKTDYILPSCFNGYYGISLYSIMVVLYQLDRDYHNHKIGREIYNAVRRILINSLYAASYRCFGGETLDAMLNINTGIALLKQAIAESTRENFDLNVCAAYSTISKLVANESELDFSSVELELP
jgi:hypothetical protein